MAASAPIWGRVVLSKPTVRTAAALSTGLVILLVAVLSSAYTPVAAPSAVQPSAEPPSAAEARAAAQGSPAANGSSATQGPTADASWGDPDEHDPAAHPRADAPGHAAEGSADGSADGAADDPANEPAGKPTHEPTDEPADEPAPETPLTVPVLLYHHLEPGADGSNGAVISTEEFAAQMAWLADNGYTSVTTADLLDWLNGAQPLPDRPVMITFDDGYRSNYAYAYPVLQQHGFTGVVFMVTSLAGQKFGSLEYLGWEDMRALAASGVIEIQAHSHDGHRLIGGEPALIAWSEEEILEDWRKLTEAMAAEGLPPVVAYAYPFGAHDEEAVNALRAAGVRLGFTVAGGRVGQGDDPLLLNRLVVFPGIGECGFARLVTGTAACD